MFCIMYSTACELQIVPEGVGQMMVGSSYKQSHDRTQCLCVLARLTMSHDRYE